MNGLEFDNSESCLIIIIAHNHTSDKILTTVNSTNDQAKQITDSTQANDKKKILGIFEEYDSSFASYELLVLAKRQMEKWKIITGIMTLSYAHRLEEDSIIHRIDDELIVIRSVAKATRTKLASIANIVGMGTIKVSDFDVDLSDLNSTSVKIYDKPKWSHYGFSLNDPWPAAVFLATGSNVGDIVGDIGVADSKIASNAQKPFFNLDELSKYFLHVSTYAADVARLYIVIPYYKKLQSIQLREKGQLNLQLIFHRRFNALDFRVSALYFNNKGEQVHGSSAINIPKSPKSSGDFLLININHDTRLLGIETAEILLIYKGKIIQRYHRVRASKEEILPKMIFPIPSAENEKNLKDYLSENESHFLDFKSSMLWDKGKDECSKNRYLELHIIRTIAAFTNSDGGVIIVGVDPDKRIIGIEQDYQCIDRKHRNWDGWIQLLQTKIEGYIENIYFGNIRVTPLVEGLITVAKIKIERGLEPVHVQYNDNGLRKYEFYIRGLNGNIFLNPEKAVDYTLKHWK
jgi:hypothetical protein